MGIFSGRNRESSCSCWIKLALVGIVIAVAFRGANCEEPTESQCRPYIEKALKEKNLDLGEKSDEETSPASGETSAEEEENPPTDENTDSTENLKSEEDDAADKDDDADSGEKDEGNGEGASGETEASVEGDQEGESGEEAPKTEEETTSQEEKEGTDEQVESGEAAEDNNKTEENATEEEIGSKENDDNKTEEEKDENVTEEKDEGDSQENKAEDSKEQAEESQEQAEDSKQAEDSQQAEESQEQAEDSKQAEGSQELAEDSKEQAEDSRQAEESQEQAEEAKEEEGDSKEQAEESQEQAEESKQAEDSQEQAQDSQQAEDSKEQAEESQEQAEDSTQAEDSKQAEESQEQADEGDSKQEETASAEAGASQEEDVKDSKEDAAAGSEEEKDADGASGEDKENEGKSGEDDEESKEADVKDGKEGEDAAEDDEKKSGEETESAEGKDEEGDGKEAAEDDGKSEEAKQESGEAVESKEDKDKEGSKETQTAEESKEAADEAPAASEEEENATEETGSEEAAKSGEDEESSPDEEDLTKEVVIPENLRPRDHITKILRLDEDSVETESVLAKGIDSTLKQLKNLYDNAIKPLEMLYKYRDLSNRHFGDPEIFSKPLVLFMGPWSGGKSSTINYLLDIEFSKMSLRTGAEPSPAYFNILMHGKEEEILDGTQLAADWTFSGLQKFGQGLLDRLRGVKLNNRLLEKVNIVEIPGILEIRKQVQRLFPFNDACQWFIDRADIIFLVYDPAKLDVGPETEAILDQLKGREYQTRIILNKADQVKPEELMRVQGTLIWNISPLMSSTEPPIMYTTSLWSLPYEIGAPTRLLLAQERAFLRDLREAIDKRVENKIASARRFAVRVRNHAKMVDCYLTTYYNHKTFFGNRKKISDDIIENPQRYHIYEGLSTLTNISRYDLPDPDVYRDFFKINPLYDFTKLSDTCTYFRGCPINKLDIAIAYDLPELVGKYKKTVEAAKEQAQKTKS